MYGMGDTIAELEDELVEWKKRAETAEKKLAGIRLARSNANKAKTDISDKQMKLHFHGSSGFIPREDEHSCFSVYDGDTKLLFDAGSSDILGCKNTDADAIFLSHTHLDHIGNLYALLGEMQMNSRKTPLDVYAPADLEELMSDQIVPDFSSLLSFECNFETKPPKQIGDFKINYLEMKQKTKPPVPVYAYSVQLRKKKVVYVTDVSLSRELNNFCIGADILICDAAIPNGYTECGHMTPSMVKELVAYSKPKQLVLTHFDLVDREDFKKQVGYPNTICAKKGLQLQVKKYKEAAVGGTFGPLHKGHEELLKRAFETSDYVMIGLTSDEMVKYKQPSVPSFDQRKSKLLSYLDKSAIDRRQYTVAMIDDPAGSVLRDNTTEALVVSKETYHRALEINKKRREQGLYEFEIETVQLVLNPDGTKLSSTDIRRHDYEMGSK